MKKIETIWHYILYQALQEKHFKHTQQDIAQKLEYSLSTVNHALSIPASLGAIRKASKFFILEDTKKLLYYWASARNLQHDVLYATHMPESVQIIEGLATPNSIYAGYSAAVKILKTAPADYAHVYFYISPEQLPAFTERFPLRQDGTPNVFVLRAPAPMAQYGTITTLPQTFVDIWNMTDWYGRDFIQALETNIDNFLSLEPGRSPRGRKEFIDIISMLHKGLVSPNQVPQLLAHYQLERTRKNFFQFLSEHIELPELALNRHQFSRLKKTILETLAQPSS